MVTIYEGSSEVSLKALESLKDKELEPSEKILRPDNFSENIQIFLADYEARLKEKEKGGQNIKVSEVLGGLARLYERIRNVVEYKGEHVLRRNAIERILKRLVWEKESVRANLDEVQVARTLIRELIWARYLPNGKIPERKIFELEKIVEKYLYLLKNLDNQPSGVTNSSIRSWIWGIASSEIEEVIEPSYRELYVQLMYKWFVSYFDWKDDNLGDYEKELQIYLAIHRALPKSDEPIMRYHLLLKEIPNWQNASKVDVDELIFKFPEVYSKIEKHLNFVGNLILYRRVQRYAAAFEIFKEIAQKTGLNLKNLVENKGDFEEEVRTICSNKYQQIRARVQTGIVRSVAYIFITKVLIAMLIEIPYEVFFYGDVRYLPLSINIVLPPFMMFLIGLSIKVPGTKNTESIVERLNSVVYVQETHERLPFSIQKSSTGSSLTFIFGFFYLVLFVLVFGGISWVLTLFDFSWVGIIIFFMFLSLVILFAFRIRYNASQLKVEGEEEGLISHLTSYITLPFLNFGVYLSGALAKVNFFTILMDFLIEIPLKNILEIFEEWTSFLKEKKEEVVEMPE